MLIIAFILMSLFASAAYLNYSSFVIWKGILVFLLCFLMLNLLYVIFWALVSAFVPMTKPISKQSAICRLGCISGSTLFCSYARIRVHMSGVEKLPKDRRFLFVSNHLSGFDPLIVMSSLKSYNISFISKPSNMRIPIAGPLSYGAGFLPIDRDNNRRALGTIVTACNYLKNDICSIGIYPEGTRSRTRSLLPFHAGSFKIAQKANVPIVVASIQGSERIKRNMLFKHTDVYLNILDVIDEASVQTLSSNELAKSSRDAIASQLEKVWA